MKAQPLVSAIIIFLNAEKFIQEAIESVFAQTYDNWELLLVDDGSCDGSTAIARRFAAQHAEEVRYLEHTHHQNRGMSASRNLGIRQARGEYIAFLDADDVWLPHKLEQQVVILGSQPKAIMLYGLSQYWYSWTGKPEDSQRDFVYKLGLEANMLAMPPALIIPFFLRQEAAIPCPSNILIRREALEQIGGFEEDFQGRYDIYEDQAFYVKLCLKAPVFVSGECWDRYRQHPDSSVSVAEKTNQSRAARHFFLNWLAAYLSKQGVKDAEIWQALYMALWQCRHPTLYNLTRGRQDWVKLVKRSLKLRGRQILPPAIYHWLGSQWRARKRWPPVGWVRLGNLRRITPISQDWGFDRGTPVDRYYIEQFLAAYASDIQGQVLEIADNTYTCQFGGDRVTRSDVLHVVEGDPKATVVADLSRADHVPEGSFNCVILTQTLQLIYDVRAALTTLYRILKPGGVLLVTVPGISQISRYDMDRWGDYWRFTSRSIGRLFEETFPATEVQVETYGNVLAAIAFLHGLATHELRQKELDYRDPNYEVVITARAVKPYVSP